MHNTWRSGKELKLAKFEKLNRKQTKDKSKEKAQKIKPIKMADNGNNNNRVVDAHADNRILLDIFIPGLGGT